VYILKYFYSSILTCLFTISARYRLPRLAALLFPLYTKKLKSADKSEKPINVLIIPKESFDEDVLTSLGQDGRFSIFSVYRMVFKTLAEGILHPSLDDNNYCSDDPEVQATKLAYRAFLDELWSKLGSLYNFQAVLSGNFGYFADHELAAALEARGVPFIVLQKENLKAPGFRDFFYNVYKTRRGPFLGRKILVYNNFERQLEIKAGVITPERIAITGMPRLDRLHQWRKNPLPEEGGRHRVLFFSFGPKTGLPIMTRKVRSGIKDGYERLPDDMDTLTWFQLSKDCHQALLRLARECPQLEVIIKSKVRERDSSAMKEMLGESNNMPSNVKIAVGGDPFQLITGSRVVCGFNTTGLFEALAAGKPVVMPRFGEMLNENMQPYIVDMEDAVEYARSPDELIDRLRHHAFDSRPHEPALGPDKIRILEKWMGNADGKSRMRVCESIVSSVNKETLPEEKGNS